MRRELWERVVVPLIVLAAFCGVYVLLDYLVHGSVRW